MRERVFITGIGCISSFGIGHREFAEAILAGKSGIVPVTAFDTSSCRAHRAATIQGFDPASFMSPLKLRRVDVVGRLALVCARLTLEDAAWATSVEGTDDVGVVLGTYTAGLDSTVEYLRGFEKNGAAGVPALLFSNTVSNAPGSLCAIEYGLRGPNVTFNQREASSLAALAFAGGSVRDGRVAAILTGGADQLEETFFKVEDRFGALSPRRSGTEEAARPFDRRRNGFVLGEGAFTLLVESGTSARRRGARAYGELVGIGATNSITAINAWPIESSGISGAMALAIADAGLEASDIDVVFAAANGSVDLDAVEAQAIREVFRDRRIPVVSLKGAIGESGAVGAASVVAGMLTIASGVVAPTAGFAARDPRCPVAVSSDARPAAGRVFVVNSVASGGANYSLVVRAGEP